MKPAINSMFFNELSVYEIPKAFIEAGYYQMDLDEQKASLFMRGKEDVKEYKKYIEDLGFSIPQAHLIFKGKGNITSYDNTYAIENLKQNLEIFNELGVESAVLHYINYGSDHIPFDELFDMRVDALNQLTDHIKDTKMSVCVENLCKVRDFDAGYLLKMCKKVKNQNNIGICLDTGHLHIANKGNQYDFIKQAGRYLKALHIHDNRGIQYGLEGFQCDWHTIPFTAGTINWDDVRDGLKETNYQGVFSYEIESNAPLEIKKLQAKYLLDCYKIYFDF